MKPNCENCVYLEADKEIINKQIEKIMWLEAELEKCTLKPLAQYLAEYLATGIDKMHEVGLPMDFTEEGLKPIFECALNAYKSGESITIKFHKN